MGRRPGSTGLRGQFVASALLVSGIVAGAFGLAHLDASADELLQNGGFETWVGDTPSDWSTLSGSTAREDSRSDSGSALHVSGAGEAVVQQTVAAYPGAALTAGIAVSVDADADVTLAVYPLDEDYFAKGTPIVTSQTIAAGESFTTISETTAPIPGWAVNARIQISVKPVDASADFSVYLDSASLSEDKPAPTSTPTVTPTSAPTDPASTSTSAVPTATSKPGGTPPAATRTPTPKQPTKAPTPKPTKRPANTPTPTRQPQYTPTPSNPDAAMTGLLENGDFEALDNGKPAYWSKYGGDMGATSDAYNGNWSATLNSDTSSTKWLSQVVSVSSGGWYQLTAAARSENATAFLRVSWYASTDGSGSAIDSADGSETSSTSWTSLATGSIQAPAEANSARIKLMLRPGGPSGRVVFDDAWFVAGTAPASTPTPKGSSTRAPATATRTATPHSGAHATTTKTKTKTSSASTKTPGKTTSGSKRTPVTHGPAASLSTVHLSDPSDAASGLRISEFMSDPPRTGSDAQDEWIEVMNVTTETVSTAGWKISDSKTSDDIPAVDVPSGGYLVIAGKSAELPDAVLVVRVADGSIGSGLNNSGDVIALVDAAGDTVDAISYGDNTAIFEPPPPAPDSGKTLGTRDPSADEAAENWDITLAPTPGEPNSFAESAENQSEADDETDSSDASVREPPQGRNLMPESKHTGEGFGTLEWILLGGGLMVIGAAVPATVKRFGPTLWTRLRRDR